MRRVLLLLIFVSITLFGAKEDRIIMSEEIPSGCMAGVKKPFIVIVTEARLKLQKKYRKKLVFINQDKTLKGKKAIKAECKKQKARYYAYFEIDKKGKQCKAGKKIKVMYNITVWDVKKNKKKKFKTQAKLQSNEVAIIKAGHVRATGKKLAKFLKK
jgi:hypothetical protein